MSADPFWSVPASDLIDQLESSPQGLSAASAAPRRVQYGPNTLHERPRSNVPALLLRQFTSPIVLLLVGAALLWFSLHDSTDGAIILGIVAVSGLLAVPVTPLGAVRLCGGAGPLRRPDGRHRPGLLSERGVCETVVLSQARVLMDQPSLNSRSQLLARLILASFLFTFMAARLLVFLIVARRIPDLYLHLGGTHVHHLNYGIFLLSGTRAPRRSRCDG